MQFTESMPVEGLSSQSTSVKDEGRQWLWLQHRGKRSPRSWVTAPSGRRLWHVSSIAKQELGFLLRVCLYTPCLPDSVSPKAQQPGLGGAW